LDNAFVIVNFDNGVRAALDLCMFAEGSVDQEALSVIGDLGKAEAFLPSSKFRFGLRSGWHAGVEEHLVEDESIRHEGYHHGASYVEHVRFMEAIRSSSAPEIGLVDGLRSVAIGVAAQRSIEEGRVVTMDEVL
jgi:predicted dehydrogenase